MNYSTFIVKFLNRPHYSLYEQQILNTEVLGKFYQFRNNSQSICKLSCWGKAAYELLKYSKTNDYFIVEGYLSLSKSTFKKSDITTTIEISIFNVYPFLLNNTEIKK